MMSPEIKSITIQDPEYPQMLVLRDDVLRKPLGMSVYNDDLTQDEADIMIVATDGETVVGCTMLKKVNETTGKLRQMAVAAGWQGKSLGRMLVLALEDVAAKNGYQTIELNARDHAISFYEKMGYNAEGPVFIEVGIPHRLMKKQLA